MKTPLDADACSRFVRRSLWLLALLGASGVLLPATAPAQPRMSLAGEEAARQLERSLTNEQYNIQYGPVDFQTQARARLGYTDNLFLTPNDRKDDLLVNPELDLSTLWRASELNTLRLTVALSYQWYLKNHDLNRDTPLINPGSELAFNLFVGDFHIRLHEYFSYQQDLFFNTFPGDNVQFFHFTDVGEFVRWDNFAGFNVDWDLNKVLLTLGYDHENFDSSTARFEYLNRASESFTASAGFRLGDQAQTGLETKGSWNRYDQEDVPDQPQLNNNVRVRAGPFVEVPIPGGLTFRTGGGFDTAQFDSGAPAGSEYKSYYAYGLVRQATRLFDQSLSGGRETLLGDTANNLRTVFVRYGITTKVIRHVELGGDVSANFAREFGGANTGDFDYYFARARVGYQFHKYIRTDLSYEYLLNKDSTGQTGDFHRNQVLWDLTFTF